MAMRGTLLALVLLSAPLAALAQDETEQERTDRGRITAFIEDNLSGAGRQVILRDFEGALSSRATASQLTIADDEGVWLTVNDIVLDWNRSSLLTGALSVNELTAGEIIVSRAPVASADGPAPEATGFSLPELPVSVDIGRISAAKVVMDASLIGQPVEGTVEAALTLNGGQGSAMLVIDRTDDGPQGEIRLDAGYDNSTRQLAIDLKAVEAANGIAVTLLNVPGQPAADLTIKGAGPLGDFSAEIALKTDGEDRLKGLVALKDADAGGGLAFTADIGGDLAPLFLPQYRDFFGPEVALKASGTRAASGALDLSALGLRTRSLDLQGAALIAADGVPERLDLRGRMVDPEANPVVLPVATPVSLRSVDLQIGYDSAEGETWRARLVGSDLVTPQATVPAFELSGSGRINRRAGDPLFGGTLRANVGGLELSDPRLAQAVGTDLSLETRIWWEASEDLLRIGRLNAEGAGLQAEVSGAIHGLSSGLRLQGQARAVVDDMARFSGLAGRDLSGRGEVRVSGHGSPLGGDFDAEVFVLADDLGLGIAQVDGLLKGPSSVDLAVVRDPTGTELRRLELRTSTLALDGSGRLDSDRVTADLSFDVKDLAIAGPGYSGTATGTARIDGPLLNGRADVEAAVSAQDLRIGIDRVDRLLSGTTRIELSGALTDAALQISRASLRGQTYSARLSGTVSAEVNDVEGRVELADLSVVLPDYAGAVEADFTARGTPAKAALTLDAVTTDLVLGIPEADGLLRGRTLAKVAADLDGQALDIAEARVTGESFTAALSGRLDLKGSDVTGRVELADLSRLRPALGGALAADLSAKGTPEKATVTVAATARGLSVGQPQADPLLAGVTTLDARVRLEAGQIRIDSAELSNPQLSAKASGQVAGDERSVAIDARLVNLALLLPEFPGPVTLSGTAVEGAGGYAVDLSGTGPGQINATVAGQVNGDFRGGTLAIRGTAQAGLANPFLGTRVLSGPVSVDLRLDGPFALSSLSGRASLSGGRMADATLPFSLTDIAADVGLAGGRASLDVSSRVSTGGSILVRGGLGLAPPFAADIDVTLSSVVVRDPQLYETRANGALKLSGPLAGGAVLSGRVALPETEIRIASTGLGATGDLAGLKHVNEPSAVRATRARAGLLDDGKDTGTKFATPYTLDLVISAPNRLFIRGRGLDAELGGELRIGGTSANVIPSGAFNLIRGRLEILGRRLDLTEANLQIEGNFDPFLRIVAATVADGVSAGIVIEGQATDPKVSFTSSPEMAEEEVLAQILFGRRLDNLSALQALQLANAVATLAGRGGEGIVSRLRSGFGLDDLDVQTSDNGSTQLRAGKYLSENLYTEVTVDQDGKSDISLNLDIGKNVTVKGRVGADGNTGLGIFFDKDY